MNPQHLKYIVEIADCHSITKAAKKLFVSQPYLSKILADTEARLKQQIFIRSSHGLELTAYGHKVYLIARTILEQLDLLEHMEQDGTTSVRDAKLSVSISNLILKDRLLLDYISGDAASKHDISLYETTIAECIDHTAQGISDFSIMVIDDYQKSMLQGVLKRRELEYAELDEGYLYYHLHKDHPLAGQENISIESLTHYPFVRLKTDDFANFSSSKFKEEHPQIQVNKSITVNHYHSYLSIVKNNGAFMIGNKWQISELEKMGIKSIRFSSLRHKVHLVIIKKELVPLSQEAHRFIHLFKESYGLNQA